MLARTNTWTYDMKKIHSVTPGHELAMALRAAYWAMHRRTNAVLAVHGVTADQFVLLSCLADEDSITQQELARRASSDANTVRPMLVLLQKRGFITRQTHDSDGRAHCVKLTAKGRRGVAAMLKDTSHFRGQMLSRIKRGSALVLQQNLVEIALVLASETERESKQQGRRAAARRVQ